MAGEDILQGAPFRHMHQHIIGGDKREPRLARKGAAAGEIAPHVLAICHRCGEPDAALRSLVETFEQTQSARRSQLWFRGAEIGVIEIGMDFRSLLGVILGVPCAVLHDDELLALRRLDEIVDARACRLLFAPGHCRA